MWMLFILFAQVVPADEDNWWSLGKMLIAALVGSGGTIAILLTHLKNRSDAKIKQATDLAQIAADEKIRLAQIKVDEEVENRCAVLTAERDQLTVRLNIAEGKIIQLQAVMDARAEAANSNHEQKKEFIAQLQAEIDRLRRIDKESRISLRDEIVQLREENNMLKKEKRDHQ